MIQIQKLCKSYFIGKGKEKTQIRALDNIDLTVNDGDFVAIIGRSGAGKSTLLNIIGLVDNYDSGEYILDGIDVKNIRDIKAAKLRNQKIGFVLQDFALISSKSVQTNVALPLYFTKCSHAEIKERTENAIKMVGLEDQTHKKVFQLSGGQKQRVAIARAIVNDPSFILADEPTGALDTKTSAEIMELFSTLNRDGKTVIIITHDPGVAGACRRQIEISDGKLLTDKQEQTSQLL